MKRHQRDLPQGWKGREIGQVAKVVGGGTPKTSDPANFSDSEGHPWITPADLTGYVNKYISHGRRFLTDQGLATSSAKYMPAGTVLFSSRAPIGYVAIASNPVTTNQGFRSLVPIDEIDSEYLYYALKFLKPVAQDMASGTTFPELSGSAVGRLPIAYPAVPDQRAIVQALDIVAASERDANSHLVAAQRTIERLSEAILDAGCFGRLTAEWREKQVLESTARTLEDLRERHAQLPSRERKAAVVESSVRDLDSGSIPKGWSVAPLKLLCEPGRPITYGILKPGPHVEKGVPYVRVMDFKSGTVSLASIKKTSAEIAAAYRRSTLRKGDLLFAIRGTYGHVAVVPPELEGANITQDTARLSIDGAIMSDYVLLSLRAPDVQRRLRKAARGIAVQGLNVGDLRELLLPVPPLEEQIEIVNRVSELLGVAGDLIRRTEAAMNKIERTSQSALAKAFRGELVSSGGAGSREPARGPC